MTNIIAHRGFSFEYPENTLLAFSKAIEAGCDGIELDVYLTQDGEIVIAHDNDIKRMTNGEKNGNIWELTLSQLKELNFGGHFTEKFGKVQIATLEEYFDLVKKENIFTNIEIKSKYNNFYEIEHKTANLIKKYDLSDRIIFSSFNHYSMKVCHEILPEVPCGLLYVNADYDIIERAKAVGAKFLHPVHTCITEEMVLRAKESGLKINAWTIDDEEDAKISVSLGVDGIITNRPDFIRSKLFEA